MKGTVLAEPEVRALLEKFEIAELFTDQDLAADEENRKLQRERFKTPALPLYVTIGPDDVERSRVMGVVSKNTFLQFLKKGLEAAAGAK
jgi:hypothetical protein